MQQKRLLLALLVSTAILLGWNYLFPIKPTQPQPEKPSSAASPQPTGTLQPTPSAAAPPRLAPTATAPPGAPHRTIVIKTPLYEGTLDSRGAVIISWILVKNKENNKQLSSVAGTRLELISREGLERQPREAPLQLVTGDPAVDEVLANSNYVIRGLDSSSSEGEINLAPNEKKQLILSLHEERTGIDVVKTLALDGNSYSFDFDVNLKRAGQVVPQVRLKIGPSIGDQGIKNYTFYSVAPEAVASVADKIERHASSSINENKGNPDHLVLGGPVDWAGVGDTYFAMVAIPSKRAEGLEYRTIVYNPSLNGKTEKRYLTTALVPIGGDGSRTILYVGPKDHYLLNKASADLGAQVGRKLDLEGLINYGWLGSISRPIAEPILWSIKKLHELTNSYGVAIILFTIIIYSAFFPLKWRSSKAMKKAQKLAPRMKELQEKIKGMKQSDPRLKELQMEQLRLMKEGNPLGGCLPLLIQMPFLFALYRAITISLDFRQATFLWLPDLSAGDHLHILEVLMAGTMIVLQLITPAPSTDPLQRKLMAIGMPLFMLYVLWGAPSGLLVYWLVGNIVGFSQQFLINRWTQSKDDDPSEKRPAELTGKKVSNVARARQA